MAEFAFEPGPEIQLAAGESAKEISGRSPWRIAGRRLLRNKLAMASLGLFLLIVVVSLLAPFYATHIAKTDPFASNLTGTTEVNGKQVDVIQSTAKGSAWARSRSGRPGSRTTSSAPTTRVVT